MLFNLINYITQVKRKIFSKVAQRWGGFAACGNAGFDPDVRIQGANQMWIGDQVTVHRGTWLCCLKAFANWPAELRIGAGTYVGMYNHIICANRVILGKDCLLANSVYISDNQHRYEDITLPPLAQGLKVFQVEIGEGVWIGEHASIFGQVKIGNHCVIGANAVVTNCEIPDYCVVVGAPSRIVRRYDPHTRQWLRTDADGNFIEFGVLEVCHAS